MSKLILVESVKSRNKKVEDKRVEISHINTVPENDDFLLNISLEQNDLAVENLNKNSKLNTMVDLLNDLALDDDLEDQSWRMFLTNKNEYKLYSLGFAYNVEKPKLELLPTAQKVYWACEDRSCPGRRNSNGMKRPLKLTKEHKGHTEKPARLDELIALQNLKEQAKNTSEQPRTIMRRVFMDLSSEVISTMIKKSAMRQIINRSRNNTELYGFNAKCLSSLEISIQLRFTYRDKTNFYMYDSGANDKNRIIFFSTQNNLKLLSSHK